VWAARDLDRSQQHLATHRLIELDVDQWIEALRPVELRFDAWKRAIMAELFPFFPQTIAPPSDAVRLAHAQVEAFQHVEKLDKSVLSKDQARFIESLKAQMRVLQDEASLNQLFDNAGLSRPAALPVTVYSGYFSGPATDSPVKGLKINEVPSPLDVSPRDSARYARVAEVLRGRGASQKIIDMTIQEAVRQKVDPLLVLAVIQNESSFSTRATSSVGARGLMQIMPGTGRGLGVSDPDQLYNPATNIKAGVRFLKSLWGKFTDFSFATLSFIDPFANKDVKKVVAAYNAGPGAVDKYDGVPPYRETQGYVVKVLRTYVELRKLYKDAQ
jgi:soluble lytic murein transglycosylase-like protein